MRKKWYINLLGCLCVGNVFAQDLAEISKQKPINFHGNVGLGLGFYHVNGIPARQRDFTYLLNGAPLVNVYGVSFPFSVIVSDQEKRYTQPFNQYGISPTYKWATLHAGWRNLEFSPFTLAGHNFLGAGLELNPGKLRFGFMYGRFKKAIEENITQPTLLSDEASYKRTGFSTKLGFGTERNHVDLIMLKAKDDVNSLQHTPSNIFLTPAENLVIGISSKFSFFKYFGYSLDVSGSAYTRNMQSDSLKNLDLGKYEFVRDWITLNASTRVSTAGETSLSYTRSNYNVKAKYRRIDPDYKSMGAYHFETDVENYTLEGGVRLLNNVLQLNGSFGLQYDNLLNEKQVTAKRKIGSFNVSYNKQSYGADLRYSNYGITQDRGINPAIDMLRVSRTNHNFTSVFRYSLLQDNKNHNIVLVGNLQSLVDLNEYTKPNSETKSQTINISYQFGVPQKSFQASAAFNVTQAEVIDRNNVFLGPTLSVGQVFLKGVLTANASASYQVQKLNGDKTGDLLITNLTMVGRLGRRNSITLSTSYLNNKSEDPLLPTFNEFRTNVGIVHSF